MEDVLRVLVIVVLAAWAGWGFLVGLRANDGRVPEATDQPSTAFGVDGDESAGEKVRVRA